MAGPNWAIVLSIILHFAIAQLYMKIGTTGVRSSALTGSLFLIAIATNIFAWWLRCSWCRRGSLAIIRTGSDLHRLITYGELPE
jgi:hypothetical protein